MNEIIVDGFCGGGGESTVNTEMEELFLNLIEAVKRFVNLVTEAIIQVFNKVIQILIGCIKALSFNRKAIHLAIHSKKWRVRKKNMNRIFKYE